MSRLFLALSASLCFAFDVEGATLHVDDFQTASTQGWSGGASPTHMASGGPSGAGDGFLQISSGGGNLATFNDRAAWTGDLAAIAAARVDVDLMSPLTSAPLGIRLVLFGPHSTNDRWVSATAANVLNDGVWRHYSFGIGPGDLTRVLGAGTHAQMLTSTLRVMLRHDPAGPSANGSPVSGALGIDNVRLAGVPEPGATVLAAAGFSLAAVRRRRG